MGLSACLIVVNKDVKSLSKNGLDVDYETKKASKAHLNNGSVVVMPSGFQVHYIEKDSLSIIPYDLGVKYDLTRKISSPIEQLNIEDVAFVEIYKDELDLGVFVSSIPGATAATILAGVAIFGSCPTYYSYDGNKFQLEAEGFSYSIAPKLEIEDLDRLHHINKHSEKILLQVRNEAFESHYIDLLKLIRVKHDPSAEAFVQIRNNKNPRASKEILLLNGEVEIEKAISSNGSDVLSFIKNKDQSWYSSSSN